MRVRDAARLGSRLYVCNPLHDVSIDGGSFTTLIEAPGAEDGAGELGSSQNLF